MTWTPQQWAAAILDKYPEVELVELFGSRAGGYERPDSDWDVLVYIGLDHYIADRDRALSVEQAITVDRTVERPEQYLEVWFCRPYYVAGRWTGDLGRWDHLEEPVPDDADDYYRECAVAGVPPGDFNRFHKEWGKPGRRLTLAERRP